MSPQETSGLLQHLGDGQIIAPIKEILELEKCLETFKKFYYREVNKSFTSNSDCTDLLYNNFKAT